MRHPPIDSIFFSSNRKQVVKFLPLGAIAVFTSNDHMPTNADGLMPYYQNNDLFYLTGIDQEDTTLLIYSDTETKKWKEIIFIKEPTPHLQKWTGKMLSQQDATNLSAVGTIMWNSEFHLFFHQLMVKENISSLFLNTNEHFGSTINIITKDLRFINWCKTKYPLHHYNRVAPILTRLRSTKCSTEIKLMKKACAITKKGFIRALHSIRPNMMEYEIEAEYLYEFVRHGSRGFAYPPIIASGFDNCVLHYTKNNKKCSAGDLLLLDVGAEYAHYNADLTRTVPVNGTFTKRQKEVYNATLRVMREAMKLMKHAPHYLDYQKAVEKLMEEELCQLNLITTKDIAEKKGGIPAFKKYFYHGISHRIGLDVHDVGDPHAPMQIGSVWTIEPGIYIQEEGFGIRLENNVVIEEDGIYDLTQNIPIEIDEIEALMNT